MRSWIYTLPLIFPIAALYGLWMGGMATVLVIVLDFMLVPAVDMIASGRGTEEDGLGGEHVLGHDIVLFVGSILCWLGFGLLLVQLQPASRVSGNHRSDGLRWHLVRCHRHQYRSRTRPQTVTHRESLRPRPSVAQPVHALHYRAQPRASPLDGDPSRPGHRAPRRSSLHVLVPLRHRRLAQCLADRGQAPQGSGHCCAPSRQPDASLQLIKRQLAPWSASFSGLSRSSDGSVPQWSFSFSRR